MDISDILQQRESRAALQSELLQRFGVPLVVLRINTPGPEKHRPSAAGIFRVMKDQLLAVFGTEIRHAQCLDTAEGETLLLAVAGEATEIKRRTMDLEEAHSLGRFVDIDVHAPESGSIGREQMHRGPRTCYLCGAPAHGCARSRRHSLESLLAHMDGAWAAWERGKD